MKISIRIKLHLLDSDPRLRIYLSDLQKAAGPVLKKVKQILPFKESVDVVVSRYRASSLDFAVSGYTPTGNLIWIYTDPSQPNYRKLLKEQLPRVLAHELHHACRWQGPGYGKTLEDALVTEGLAGHFEEEVVGGKPSAFYVKFNNRELASLLKHAKSDLKSSSYNYRDWFFGNKTKKIKPHSGYALGYKLTSQSISGIPPSKLVMVKTRQVLKNMI